MTVRSRKDLHRYQEIAVEHIKGTPRSMLWLFMGAGKTAATLTAVSDLFATAQVHGVLVIAPRRVAESVWAQEAARWAHLAHLKICVLRGSNKRLLERALASPRYHVWVVNYEALPWLAPKLNQLFLSHGRWLPFNMLIFDEVTRVKNSEGRRVSLLYSRAEDGGARLIDHFPRRVGLTGTPAPNGYEDLYGSFLAVDDGVALGRDLRVFRERYFVEDFRTGRRELAPHAKEHIEERIAPIVLNMNAEDYLELPEYVYNDIWIDLPSRVQTEYERLEREMWADLDHGRLEVFNQASITAKCRQLANGMVIDTVSGGWNAVHEAKLEALDEVLEEAGGRPVLTSYIFRADMERIRARYEKRRYRVAYLGPGVNASDGNRVIDEWNGGKFHLLLLHHASGGHGINLQGGGHIVAWFGLDWPLEGYQQLNARLRRQGQTAERVFVHRLLARATVDEAVRLRLDTKASDQDDLRAAVDALRAYRTTKRPSRAA